MIRLSKLTDYGLVLMSYIARSADRQLHTAQELARESRLPLPTVSKILKGLLQSGLLVSYRGIKGGYALTRDTRDISVAEIISALEGPIAMTECSTHDSELCEIERCCPIKENQRVISEAVRGALDRLSLFDLSHPLRLTMIRDQRGRMIPSIGFATRTIQ